MQAIYAWYATGDEPGQCFDINLKDFADEIREIERQKGDKGDTRLLMELYYETIKNHQAFDQLIESKAENWELDRIAVVDRILMQMGICEMLRFSEIPIKVSINEYLEIAKKFSTPKSSKFINGILDSLYLDFKNNGKIQKAGRGLIEETLPKGAFPPDDKKKRPRINKPGEEA
jgi:transcription antitermination factor NusB